MKTIVLGDRQTVLLFSLAGMEGMLVETQPGAVEAIKQIRRSKEYGLMIMTQKVAAWAPELVAQIRFSKSKLIVIEIPDRDGQLPGGKSLADYIREAVGIRI